MGAVAEGAAGAAALAAVADIVGVQDLNRAERHPRYCWSRKLISCRLHSAEVMFQSIDSKHIPRIEYYVRARYIPY